MINVCVNDCRRGRRLKLHWRLGCGIVATLAALAAISPQTTAWARHPLSQSAAAELGFDETRFAAIEPLVAAAIAEKKLPGCVVAIGRSGGIGWLHAYGERRLQPESEPMTVDTVFDLASLTKPLATGLSMMHLVERGQVRLRAPVSEIIPEFAQGGKAPITVEQLLIHHSGFIPDNPLGDYEHGVDESWRRLFALEPQTPPGTKFIYSDVNFEVLGDIVRRVSGLPVNEYARRHIYEPLGLRETGYLPGEELRQRAAPTEQREGRWMQGEVHDPRSYLLGGVAGHAGLFSTASDLAVICDALLHTIRRSDAAGVPISHATALEMIRPRDVSGAKRALAWDSASSYSVNRGELFSSRAFGHGGFTGTALWIDPELDLFVIFLSNRVHPDGKGSVNDLAGRIGTIAAGAIAGPNKLAAATASGSQHAKREADGGSEQADVLCGIDVLEREGFARLVGKRVGLITNHTGVNRAGKSTIDLLHEAPGVTLAAIFSPEHGIAGKLDQPDIGDARHEGTGVSIYSLYGKTNRPAAEKLREFDAVVFDIQDVGARFYTYVSTMGLAMEAAAEAGVPFFVLDRPNPIGGLAVEGPVRDANAESFVAYHEIPVRHGMTTGELARMFAAERHIDVDLQIVPVEGWRRGELWDRTGLTWINPSPNMRSLNEALLYPGVGLVEFTNVSVGRGTDTPFEVLGAPWIDAQEFAAALNAARLPGVRFIPLRFTPVASRHAGQECGGVNIHIVERDALQPVDLGLTLACTLRKLYPNQWEVDRLAKLLCSAEALEAIRAGAGLEKIRGLYQDDLEKFRRRREPFLIYAE